MAERRLDIKIGAQDQTGPAFASAAAKAKALQGQLSAGGLKGVKAALGEESAFGSVAKMLTGAGAIAGLTISARLLGDMAGKAAELRDAMAAGTMEAADLAGALIDSLPILSDLKRAMIGIAEVISPIGKDWSKEIEAGIGSSAALRQKMLVATGQTLRAAREAADQEQAAALQTSRDKWGAMANDPRQAALAAKQLQIDAENAAKIHDAAVQKAVADDEARRQAEFDKRQAAREREAALEQKSRDEQLARWKTWFGAFEELREEQYRHQGRVLEAELTRLRANLRLRLLEERDYATRQALIRKEALDEAAAREGEEARRRAQRAEERALGIGNRQRMLVLEGRGGEAERLERAESFGARIRGAHTPAEANELARQWILEDALARQRATPVYSATVPSRFVSPGYTDLAGDARAKAQDNQLSELRRIVEFARQQLAKTQELVQAVREQAGFEGVELRY